MVESCCCFYWLDFHLISLSTTSIQNLFFSLSSPPYFSPSTRHEWRCAILPSGHSCLIREKRFLWPWHLAGSAHIRETMPYTFSSTEQTERDAPTGPKWKNHMNANRPGAAERTPWMRGPVWFNPSNAPWTSRTHRFHRHYAGLLFALRL